MKKLLFISFLLWMALPTKGQALFMGEDSLYAKADTEAPTFPDRDTPIVRAEKEEDLFLAKIRLDDMIFAISNTDGRQQFYFWKETIDKKPIIAFPETYFDKKGFTYTLSMDGKKVKDGYKIILKIEYMSNGEETRESSESSLMFVITDDGKINSLIYEK